MKLLRYGNAGQEKPGILDTDGNIRDLSPIIADINPETIQTLETLTALDVSTLPIVGGKPRIGACIAHPSKIVCVGLNYKPHVTETRQPLPSEPVLFMKAISSISGPYDHVMLPRGSEKTDWEVELALIIGKKAQYVEEKHALDYVAGYCIMNDISERAYQFDRGGTWTKGKSADTFAPIGPYLVTKDDVPDPQALDLYCEVNGERVQNCNTRDMIFTTPYLISYISQFMTLLPGDIVSTGTPAGVGYGLIPQRFLKAGDVMQLGVAGLGEQRQKVVSYGG